jgi:hypothetical protein
VGVLLSRIFHYAIGDRQSPGGRPLTNSRQKSNAINETAHDSITFTKLPDGVQRNILSYIPHPVVEVLETANQRAEIPNMNFKRAKRFKLRENNVEKQSISFDLGEFLRDENRSLSREEISVLSLMPFRSHVFKAREEVDVQKIVVLKLISERENTMTYLASELQKADTFGLANGLYKKGLVRAGSSMNREELLDLAFRHESRTICATLDQTLEIEKAKLDHLYDVLIEAGTRSNDHASMLNNLNREELIDAVRPDQIANNIDGFMHSLAPSTVNVAHLIALGQLIPKLSHLVN